MRIRLYFTALALLPAIACTQTQQPASHGYPIDPVPFTSVKVTDSFWGQRLKASREVTIPLAFSKCEETGRYLNFEQAYRQMNSKENLGFPPSGFPFDDTDVYKTIEGASYVLQTYPDAKMEAYIDSVLTIVAAAQEPDGYLYTPRTMNPEHPHPWSGLTRWSEVEGGSHEFYNLGHMLEAAVAHYQATGKRNFLDIAIRYADCVIREIGEGEGQTCVVPGHQIAEMGLAKLYLATGDRKYLDQAKFFLDKRGTTKIRSAYSQSHIPVLEQDEAVGHAVRAAYMYAGMADVAALTGDSDYIKAIDRIWENIVQKKLYITGGIGATSNGEAFGRNYELPNMSAYCETCAAIGNVYVNYRLFLLHGQSKYYDVLERTLYNGLISGVSLDGGGFFYPNPLESMGQHQRQAWFGCACCPSNVSRFLPSVGNYVYGTSRDALYVNLYIGNEASLNVDGKQVSLAMNTQYPWDGTIRITFRNGMDKALKMRIPGWCKAYKVTVNGKPSGAVSEEKGYAKLSRKWKKGDVVELQLAMPVEKVAADERVKEDKGKRAIQRGPLVYCAEAIDNAGTYDSFRLSSTTRFALCSLGGMLQGMQGITADNGREVLRLIPYYAWDNRDASKMKVWIDTDE